MKTNTSITLSSDLFNEIDERSGNFKSRSDFIEAAVRHFIGHLGRREAERKDLEIINRHAEAMNEEAEDALSYQAPI